MAERRLLREYAEQPGLCLTERQVRRLLSVDDRTCQLVLEALVANGMLKRSPDGQYVRGASPTRRRFWRRRRKSALGSTPRLMRAMTLVIAAAFVAGGLMMTPISELVVVVTLAIAFGAVGLSLVRFLEWRQNLRVIPTGTDANSRAADESIQKRAA
jgi:hypothetical protein